MSEGGTHSSVSIRRNSVSRRSIVFEICGVGIPASIQNLLNVTGMTILNNSLRIRADAVAAMGIAYKIYMVPMQVSLGFSQASCPW